MWIRSLSAIKTVIARNSRMLRERKMLEEQEMKLQASPRDRMRAKRRDLAVTKARIRHGLDIERM